ncbi:MAG TPA: hypothetical protein VKV28_15570 [Candidatus Binataceae bacterium]|nr:hypothetical protein [Candidatus Binataceae bacterium]
MKKRIFVAIFVLAAGTPAWAGDYQIYSWQPRTQVAVKSLTCDSFLQARHAAAVLDVLHILAPLPGFDSHFAMINDSADPLRTWVMRANEPYEPHEYLWTGERKSEKNSDSHGQAGE